ncbi:amino acid permease [Diplodia corticola]|uniref:Amino acid permease n=1 Tax=Diplodia corticola TaxID=236234 RepID=A0A1J9RQX0_9PEZI|nr:amino acid permease [Diplodia corticola]OJD30831.1 amino acid permease [Diplodia corticola]
MARSAELTADELQLESLGHKGELKRQFSFLSMLGLAFAILNSWTALSTSLSLALPSGGPTSVVWGLITAGICNLCLAASLAEFLSAYPTAGGQYHWVAVISWKAWVPALSWTTGWINTFGWIALVCTGGLLGSQLVVGVISLENPNYEPQAWHQFLIYIGYNVLAFCINAFANSSLPYVNKAAITWSIAGFAIICITILACASPNYSTGDFVFRKFINETGWPDGIAWLLGLLQGGLGLTGFDAVAHMIEEIPNAAVEGPKIMVYCVLIGTFTGFIFLVSLLFVAGNIDDVISSSAGPLLQILFNATNSHAGAICLLIFPLVCMLFATTSIMTTSSRMVYAFARDGGLPFSRHLSKVHHGLDIPLNALLFTTSWVIIFGCIFLGSDSAFNAITAASVVSLGISYGLPIAINCMRGRKMLPPRSWTLSEPVAWVANLIGVAYVIVTTVLFVFPPELPVSGSNMNYCIVVFAIVILISSITWIFDGRKNYRGPKIDEGLEVIEATKVGPNGSVEGDNKAHMDDPDSKYPVEA